MILMDVLRKIPVRSIFSHCPRSAIFKCCKFYENNLKNEIHFETSWRRVKKILCTWEMFFNSAKIFNFRSSFQRASPFLTSFSWWKVNLGSFTRIKSEDYCSYKMINFSLKNKSKRQASARKFSFISKGKCLIISDLEWFW